MDRAVVLRRFGLVAAMLLPPLLVPRWVCGLGAENWFEGDASTQRRLGDHVAQVVGAQKAPTFFRTGAERFDGQSAVAIYQMTLLGLGQLILQHAELRETYLPVMRQTAKHLADPETLRYAAQSYGHHGVATTHFVGHAYLGYINLGLGMLRLIEPDMELASLHDRITTELAKQLDASPNGHIETYPGETWPPDVAAVAGSIGLHARATGTDRRAMLDRWSKRFAECAISPSGYLYQRLQTGTCRPADLPRGSGTAIGAYFISFASPPLAAQLHDALHRNGWRSFLGFGGIREYAPGMAGQGDGNSGPVVFGVSVGATGFALASARVHGDRELFVELVRTATLFGVPASSAAGESFAAGGILGNALLLAMLTARAP